MQNYCMHWINKGQKCLAQALIMSYSDNLNETDGFKNHCIWSRLCIDACLTCLAKRSMQLALVSTLMKLTDLGNILQYVLKFKLLLQNRRLSYESDDKFD